MKGLCPCEVKRGGPGQISGNDSPATARRLLSGAERVGAQPLRGRLPAAEALEGVPQLHPLEPEGEPLAAAPPCQRDSPRRVGPLGWLVEARDTAEQHPGRGLEPTVITSYCPHTRALDRIESPVHPESVGDCL